MAVGGQVTSLAPTSLPLGIHHAKLSSLYHMLSPTCPPGYFSFCFLFLLWEFSLCSFQFLFLEIILNGVGVSCVPVFGVDSLLLCHQSWWLVRVFLQMQGISSFLSSGVRLHKNHTEAVTVSGMREKTGYWSFGGHTCHNIPL